MNPYFHLLKDLKLNREIIAIRNIKMPVHFIIISRRHRLKQPNIYKATSFLHQFGTNIFLLVDITFPQYN